MSVLIDIGARVELVSMDGHFHDISIALYRQDRADGPAGLVHTYSTRPGAPERVAFVTRAMAALGGLELVEGSQDLVRFPCGTWHAAAARRVFLEACKTDPSVLPDPRPLETIDRKTGQQIRVEPLDSGAYRVLAEGVAAGTPSRAPAIAAGLAKLAELAPPAEETVVSFPCERDHHALTGLLLVRALNVRAVLREEEQIATRGVLVAPSAQQQG